MKFVDAIYGTVVIHDRDIINLIETKAFQRLSHIKQQGHTYYLHSNAIHTRIEHSIGVYTLVNKVIDHLTVIGDITFSEYERKVVSVVALLHDIGHGPYSHCFQRISGQNHGDWTIRIIQEDKEIRTILERTPNLLGDVINALSEENSFPIIDELLFCSLGMDQLDFWNRDLHYSSLKLERIPIEKLISTMRIVNQKLVIEEAGVPYIEHLVKVKSSLYHNGFGHPFIIGKDLLLQEIFRVMQEEKIPFVTSELKVFFNKREEERLVTDFLVLNDKTICNEIEKLAMNKGTEAAALAHLYLSSSSSLQWMEGKNFNSKINREDVSVLGVITEKKNYSSYTGGIFVKKDDGLYDIMHSSNYIREIASLPLKEHTYFLEKSRIIIKK
ncbi:metal-dependent phosphohydrolase [Bacillus cereus]|uniref:Metal-dependent phosphohydrolase n=1 Tax=Bacillus cereus TaxID=1396 RepID=A0A2B0MEA1_BACCE|nr:metal-dependent phosphohydrolase [Bacillus cereus]